MILDIENWLWKSDFGTFDSMALYLPFTKTMMINILWLCWFQAKNQSNFVFSPWKLDSPPYPSLQARNTEPQRGFHWKFTSTPKLLGMAKAYFVCHIGPIFSDIFDLCFHWVFIVLACKEALKNCTESKLSLLLTLPIPAAWCPNVEPVLKITWKIVS